MRPRYQLQSQNTHFSFAVRSCETFSLISARRPITYRPSSHDPLTTPANVMRLRLRSQKYLRSESNIFIDFSEDRQRVCDSAPHARSSFEPVRFYRRPKEQRRCRGGSMNQIVEKLDPPMLSEGFQNKFSGPGMIRRCDAFRNQTKDAQRLNDVNTFLFTFWQYHSFGLNLVAWIFYGSYIWVVSRSASYSMFNSAL